MNIELELRAIRKKIRTTCVLESFNLAINAGEKFCLLGPSGCGKTTLLRIAAGLLRPDSGEILFQGRALTGIPPHQRQFGMMFQDYALFPHRNVADNIAFGLQMKGLGRKETASIVNEMLCLVSLEGYGNRQVEDLSGGEQQRVALARTLAPKPRILMLDEPFGSLDRLLRERLIRDLGQILDTTGITSIIVTHDHSEAFALADRICVMDQGRVLQVGSPEEIYSHPATPTVADLLGFQNMMDCTVQEKGSIQTCCGEFHAGRKPALAPQQGSYRLLILPDSVMPEPPGDASGPNRILGRVAAVFFQGATKRLHVAVRSGQELVFHVPRRTVLPEAGNPVVIAVDPEGLRLFHQHGNDITTGFQDAKN